MAQENDSVATVRNGNDQPPGMWKAIHDGKCPVCQRGRVFRNKMWNLGGFLATHKYCPHCNTQFEKEPGFFWGAMYINYGFNVATIATIGIATWVLFNPESIFAYFIPIFLGIVLTIPFTTRASRMIMLHVFGPFNFDEEKFRQEETD